MVCRQKNKDNNNGSDQRVTNTVVALLLSLRTLARIIIITVFTRV